MTVMPIGLVLLPILLALTAFLLGMLALVAYWVVAGLVAMTHGHHAHVRR